MQRDDATEPQVAAKQSRTHVMKAIDEHHAYHRARLNADASRAKEQYDRKRAINDAVRFANDALSKSDSGWAIKVCERGLLNDPAHGELLALLHKVRCSDSFKQPPSSSQQLPAASKQPPHRSTRVWRQAEVQQLAERAYTAETRLE
jgi:hypothetical protein